MNFYSPVSNSRSHSIGHKIIITRIKIRVRVEGDGKEPRDGTRNFVILKMHVFLNLKRNIGIEDEFRVSGGSDCTETVLCTTRDKLRNKLRNGPCAVTTVCIADSKIF